MLSRNTRIKSLRLSDNCIGATGGLQLARALEAHPSLTTLHLAWNGIGVGGLGQGATAIAKMVASNRVLSTLNLCDNGLVPPSISAIAGSIADNTSSALTSVNFSINDVGDEGAAVVARALTTSTCHLTSLDLGRSSIGSKGADALVDALRVNHKLCSLTLTGNSLGASCM
jgi:Ran GTPase-activating protein (RanGAP) involved in mRNA processing and transport